MITFDLETRSYADLPKVGAWAYSEDPTTDVICACWGIDDAPIQEWWPGKNDDDAMPTDLYMALMLGHEIEAHNVAFERSIWENVLAPKYGWMIPLDHQWRDTMAVAAYYALPQKLDKLAQVLGFQGKDPEGGRLITKYSKLFLKTAKLTTPDDDFFKFVDYCKQDVRIEQSISDYLGDLPERELPNFKIDQEINMRGLYLDLEGIEAASAIVDQRAEELTAQFRKITGVNPTQRDRCIEWFAGQGLVLENMQADYLEELLDDGELPQGPARRALEIRLQINKASTKKLDAMARQRGKDGRARFQTRYHGTQTGRDAGSGFQPLNLNRGFDDAPKDLPERLAQDIMYRDPRWLDCLYGDAMDAVSKASRYWITAEEGNKLVAGDFVSIEAVVLACLAGEDWKVDAFRSGAKIYELMADKIYNLPPGTVTKKTHPAERQDGKTGELAFGFQGALGAWLKFDNSGRHTDERIIEICKAWRAEHPAIVEFWRELEKSAIEAVRRHGVDFGYREIGFEVVDDWLSMVLPDGKRIWYWKPELRMGMPQWHQPAKKEDCREGKCDCKPQLKLTYMAKKEGQWRRINTYGGKLCENATQATARQILTPAVRAVSEYGYPPILRVYDEIVAEVPEGFGSAKEFEEIMQDSLEPWCQDWPIRADAWEGKRYRK